MITRVITEQDLLRGGVASPIVLDASTLLTPAARDRAVRMGLTIVERGEAKSEPGLYPADAAGRALVAATGGAGAVHAQPAQASAATAGRAPAASSGCTRCGGACKGTCDPATRASCPHGATSSAGAAWTSGNVSSPSALPTGTADGLYLVRVEGGRIVSLLPAAGPGQMTRSRIP